MAKIYYVGDWAVMLGPCFAETPFNYAMKGTDIFNYGTWLKEALESTGELMGRLQTVLVAGAGLAAGRRCGFA